MQITKFNKTTIFILLGFFLLTIITFETFQQLYYIKQFQVGNTSDITFLNVLKNHSYRWFIWLLLSFFVYRLVLKKSLKSSFTFIDLLHYIFLVIGLTASAIILISLVQWQLSGVSFSAVINDFIPFFTYQKALTFIIGNIVIIVVFHLYFINEKLQIQVQSLIEIKKTNIDIYTKLRSKNEDNSEVLNIKIGNKRKVIPVRSISWIESDDYCVKVHTDDEISYSMRSSLKSLEDKLVDYHFLRVHRNALVNMKLVKEIDFSIFPKLILKNSIEVPIAKSKIKIVKEFST